MEKTSGKASNPKAAPEFDFQDEAFSCNTASKPQFTSEGSQ
jgi:hypothetical protein